MSMQLVFEMQALEKFEFVVGKRCLDFEYELYEKKRMLNCVRSMLGITSVLKNLP